VAVIMSSAGRWVFRFWWKEIHPVIPHMSNS
jgi:hypothetical protein